MKSLFSLSSQLRLRPLRSLRRFSAKGSWYLGTGDATTLLNVFSSGVGFDATVGYAVADDIVVTAKSDFGGTFDALNLSIGGQYFMGDYYVGLDVDDPINNLDLGINAGRY